MISFSHLFSDPFEIYQYHMEIPFQYQVSFKRKRIKKLILKLNKKISEEY